MTQITDETAKRLIEIPIPKAKKKEIITMLENLELYEAMFAREVLEGALRATIREL